MTTSSITQNAGFYSVYDDASILAARKANAVEKNAEFNAAMQKENEKKCPYSYLAKDGMINYRGVTFMCDYEHNAINLGDVSDPNKVLRVALPSGGSLNINVDNLGSISQVASMFSPADLNAILNAIQEYNHCASKVNEIEEEESLLSQLQAHSAELANKIINNDTEQKFRIGGQEFSIKEWDKLLDSFDKKEDAIREEMREEIKDRMSKEELEERINQLTADRA